MGDNFRAETDETEPKPYGHHLARAYVSWPGTFVFLVTLIFGFVTIWQFLGYIDVNGLSLGMTLAIFVISGALWLFDVFYWSASLDSRGALAPKRGGIGVKPVTSGQKKERLLKSNGDQHLLTVLFGYSGWILIIMAAFYAKHGLHTFQPLSFSPNGFEITNFLINKLIQVAIMAMTAQAFSIAVSTDRDTVRRLTSSNPYYIGGKGSPDMELNYLKK